MAARLSSQLEQLFHPAELRSIAVSVRGHAFVSFAAAAAAEAALRREWSLDGRQLAVQRRGGSGVHELRGQLHSQLPPVRFAERTAYWLLPPHVGGGLVAVAPAGGLKETRALLAAETLRFLERGEPEQHALRGEEGAQAALVEETSSTSSPSPLEAEEDPPPPVKEEEGTPSALEEEEGSPAPVKEEESPGLVKEEEGTFSPLEEEGGSPSPDDEEEGPPSPLEEEEDASPPLVEEEAGEVRNLCIIAHVDHGKTTLADCLLAAAGALSSTRAGEACALDHGLEAERGITIYSSAVTLSYPSRRLSLSLVDCPGHAEFNSEVTAALRLSDAALLLVDVQEGMMAQSEAVLRQALSDGVRVLLVLNKVDKLLPDTRHAAGGAPLDEAVGPLYERMEQVIAQVNDVIHAHHAAPVGLEDGTVVFGSGRLGWMASLHSFARLYAAKAAAGGGEAAYAAAHAAALRAMCKGRRVAQLALAPLAELHALAGERDAAALDEKASRVSGGAVRLPKALREAADAKAMRRWVFGALFSAADTLLEMVEAHAPSPAASQRRRAALLSPPPSSPAEGSTDGGEAERAAASAAAIRACDPSGPLLLYVSKMAPLPGTKAHAAVCRVYSGTVRPASTLYLLSPSTTIPRAVRVSRVLRLTPSAAPTPLAAGAAGRVVALLGLDTTHCRGATLTDSPSTLARLCPMRFTVSAVERRALAAPAGAAARKLAAALPALLRGDPLVTCARDSHTGELVLCGAGELHLEACVHRLREAMGAEGGALCVAPAAVAHREGVAAATPRTDARPGCLGKSANRHNRFWFVASPLPARLAAEGGAATPAALVEAYGWEKKHAARVLGWCGANVLVDSSVGVVGVDGVADHLLAAFTALCAAGPLCAEALHAVRLDLTDAKIHADAAQRRAPQVTPAARRGMAAALLAAQPTLLEPMHALTLRAPLSGVAEVYDELSRRRADDVSHEAEEGDGCVVSGCLPLSEAAGLSEKLRGRLRGRASGLTLAFSHWRPLEGSAWDGGAGGAACGAVVASIRARKKMGGPPPTSESMADRL